MLPTSPSGTNARERVERLEATLQQVQQDQGAFATTVNAANAADRQRMLAIEIRIRESEEAIKAAFDGTAARTAGELAKVISDAKAEFDAQRQQLQGVTAAVQVELSAVQGEFAKLQQQVNESSTREGGGKGGGKSFVPLKDLKPAKLGKEEQWRDWSELFAEYLEASCAGMKECLQRTAAADNKPDKDVVSTSEFSHLADRAESLYSALKHLTEEGSAARRVITSTPKEDGFAAWWGLNATFTQALAARQGQVMALFTNTHSRPSKHPAETRHKLIEVDNATKRWCEIMCEEVPEAMLRTAYVGILDPITRQHLTNFQGKGTKPQDLKQEILRFVSNAVASTTAMDIGSFEEFGGFGGTDGAA